MIRQYPTFTSLTNAKRDSNISAKSGESLDFTPPVKDFFWDVFFNAKNILAEGNVEEGLSENDKLCRDLKSAVEYLKAANIYRMLPEIGMNIGYTVNGKTVADDNAVVCA